MKMLWTMNIWGRRAVRVSTGLLSHLPTDSYAAAFRKVVDLVLRLEPNWLYSLLHLPQTEKIRRIILGIIRLEFQLRLRR